METPSEYVTMEQALLAGILYDQKLLRKYIGSLKGDYFVKEFNKVTMDAILKLDERQIPIDVLTVNNMVKSYGINEEIAGQILQWTNPELSDEQFLAYTLMLKENYQRCELVAQGNHLIEKGLNPEFSIQELLSDTEQTINKLNDMNHLHFIKPMKEVIADFLKEVSFDSNQLGPAIHRWFNDELDAKLTGLRKGELIILGARPGMGKTSFLVSQMLHSLFIQKKKVAFVSMESDKDLLTYRMLAQQAEIELPNLLSGKLTEAQHQRLKELADSISNKPLHLLDKSKMNVYELRHTLRQIQTNHGLDLIIVDYLQLLNPGRKSYYREQEIAGVIQVLKQIARELDIPVLVSSQLSRATEYRGMASFPLLSDLRESGSIEQTADKVIFIYRPEYYGITELEDGSSTDGVAELQIAKNRLGPLGTARLRFNHQFARFENYDHTVSRMPGYIVPHTRKDEFSPPPF